MMLQELISWQCWRDNAGATMPISDVHRQAADCPCLLCVLPCCVLLCCTGPKGFTVKAPARSSATANGQPGADKADAESDAEGDDSSGWETASLDDEDADVADGPSEDWAEWDPCVSFFDNKASSSMEENLQYMYKNFGFFLPDAEYLADPEGLIKYLGAKISYGKVGTFCHAWVLSPSCAGKGVFPLPDAE